MKQFKLSEDVKRELGNRTVEAHYWNSVIFREAIDWVRTYFPEHEMVVVQTSLEHTRNGVALRISSVQFWHSGMLLGYLTSVYSARSKGYAVEIEGFKGGRRERILISKDISRLRPAMRTVFAPPELSRILGEAGRVVGLYLFDHAAHLRRKLILEENKLETPMREFVRENAEAFVAFVGDASRTAAWVEGLAARAEHTEVMNMYNDFAKGHMAPIAELDDGTFVIHENAYASFDDIPEKYKEALGMLKLSEGDLSLDDVGVKVGKRYVVYPRA